MNKLIECFKSQGIPPKTVQLLTLIWPYPIGEALKIEEAAERLGIKVNTAYQRLRELKKTCPMAYEKFREERKIQSGIGQFIHRQAYLTEKNRRAYLKPKYRRILRTNLHSIGVRTWLEEIENQDE